MPITSVPAPLRPRERLLSQGVEPLGLADLVAVILGSGSGGHSVYDIAGRVSDSLLNGCMSLEHLSQIPGVGRAKALEITAAMALRAKVEQGRRQRVFDQPETVYEAMRDLLDCRQEHLAVFYLTTRSHLLQREIVGVGTLSASIVHAREVFRPAIAHNAMHVILAHNHPSGVSQASEADYAATRYVARAGQLLGIELLDHVVCAKDGYVSLRQARPELFFTPQI